MGQRFARGLATLVASSLVLLVAGEIAARVFARSHWDTRMLDARLHDPRLHPLTVPAQDPAILYRLRPGLDVEYLGARVVTDSAGLHVLPSAASEPQGALRIALVGDSTSFGWGVALEDSYGELLRSALEKRSGRPVVLRNYSVPGYNADQELHALLETLPAFRPDLLIVHHDHNDWQPTGWEQRLSIAPEFGDNLLHSALLKLLERRIEKIRITRANEAERAANEFLGEYCVRGPFYEALMASRKALADEMRKRSIPTLLLLFNSDVPANEHFEADETYLRLHKSGGERLKAMGYTVLDLYPHLQRYLAESHSTDLHMFWLGPDDHHPNAHGHAFVARVLAEFISSTPELEGIFDQRR